MQETATAPAPQQITSVDLTALHEECGRYWGNHFWEGTLADGFPVCISPEYAGRLQAILDELSAMKHTPPASRKR